MTKVFPASFPNKQYQLLFTQGTGESKEGESSGPTRSGYQGVKGPLDWSVLIRSYYVDSVIVVWVKLFHLIPNKYPSHTSDAVVSGCGFVTL